MAKDKKQSSGGASGASGRSKASPDAPGALDRMSPEQREAAFPVMADNEEKEFLIREHIDQNLNYSQTQAVKFYKDDGFEYINAYLRNNGEVLFDEDYTKDMITELDSITYKSTQNMTLFRGMDTSTTQGKAFFERVKNGIDDGSVWGSTFTDLGFVSTSVLGNTAFDGSMQLKIRAPKGTPSIVPNRIGPAGDEAEIILQRNTKFRILSASLNGDNMNLELEVVL